MTSAFPEDQDAARLDLATAPLHEVIALALQMTRARRRVAPDIGMYEAIEDQLRWMQDCESRHAVPSPESLDRITAGTIAVHNFEDGDPVYMKVLVRASGRFLRKHDGA